MVCWHEWSGWKDVKRFTSAKKGDISIVQRKYCKKCGKVKLKKETTEGTEFKVNPIEA